MQGHKALTYEEPKTCLQMHARCSSHCDHHLWSHEYLALGSKSVTTGAACDRNSEGSRPQANRQASRLLRPPLCGHTKDPLQVWPRHKEYGCCRYIDMINAASGLAESMLQNPALAAETEASGVGPRIAIMAQPGAIAAHDGRRAMSPSSLPINITAEPDPLRSDQ